MSIQDLIRGLVLVLLVSAAQPAMAQDSPAAPAKQSPGTQNALDILSRATQFIESVSAFSTSGNFGGDLVSNEGQIVEHGSAFAVVFSRPDKLYMKLESRGGYETSMFLDGEIISVEARFNGRLV